MENDTQMLLTRRQDPAEGDTQAQVEAPATGYRPAGESHIVTRDSDDDWDQGAYSDQE